MQNYKLDQMHPALKELVKLIPRSGPWPAKERVLWMKAFEAVNCLVWRNEGSVYFSIPSVLNDVHNQPLIDLPPA